MEGLGPVAAAAAAFVGTHFLLSHPQRKPIVDTVGSAAFLGIYSAVAAATLGWLALAYLAAPAGTLLWPVGDGLWGAATVVMVLASILLMGSIVRNPALWNSIISKCWRVSSMISMLCMWTAAAPTK